MGGATPDPAWTDAPPTANTLVKELLVNHRIRWGQAPTAWDPPYQSGWAPLVDPGPRALQTARSVGRWLWPTLAAGGFLLVAGFVLAHDDPTPGLSIRGLVTIALAALVVVLLTIHRSAGPGPLARATAEYGVVFLLAVLLATTGIPLDQPTAAAGTTASTIPDERPALIKTLDDFRNWLSEWRQWAHQERDRPSRSAAITTPGPEREAWPALLPDRSGGPGS